MRLGRCWDISLAVFAAILVLAIAGVAIAQLVLGSETASEQRICYVATGDRAGSGSPGEALGMISFFLNQREISWYAQYRDLQGIITALTIYGPIPEGQAVTDTIAVPLCGTPSTLVCDTSVPGRLQGTITSFSPGETSLRPVITTIREETVRYYIQFTTSAHPTGQGELIGLFTSTC